MATAADIVVTAPDSTEVKLVVETKLRLRSVGDAEGQLKQYMWLVKCPLGLIVTPETIFIYRDTYTSPTPATIERVGQYETRAVMDFRPQEDSQGSRAFAFEIAVQGWIESIVQTDFDLMSIKDPELRRVMAGTVLPAIQFGVVRAAGPRSAQFR